jgi:hypothetical protein
MENIYNEMVNWEQDEQYLVKTGTILHKLRTNLPQDYFVYYFYTTESRKSARYKITTQNRITFHLRVEFQHEKCRLILNGKTHKKFDSIQDFTDYLKNNID